MKHFTFYITFAALTLSFHLSAQIGPKYSNDFLNIGTGARALGMSGAYTALVDDVTGGYWNPAGLTKIDGDIQIGLMHSEYFAGIAKYDFGAVAKKIDERSAIGFTAIRFGIDNIPETTDLIDANGNINYDRIRSFNAVDYAFLLSYGRKAKNEALSYGANAKVIHRTIGPFGRSWGFGIDVGMQYVKNGWMLGIMGRDITTTFNAWSYTLSDQLIEVFERTNNEIPENSIEITSPTVMIGGGRTFNFNEKFALSALINLVTSTDGMRNTVIKSNIFSIDPAVGFEASYKKLVYLRGGVGNFQQVSSQFDPSGRVTTYQPNIGLGLRIGSVMIDYALTDIGDRSIAPYSNVFSLRFNINAKKKES
jgi:hypothetical protein